MSRFLPCGLVLGFFALGLVPLSAAPTPPSKVPRGLLKARLEAARETFRMTQTRVRAGMGSPRELFGWSRRWLDAELALSKDRAARLAALEAHVNRTREMEHMTHALARTGQGRPEDANAATYYRSEAEILLLEAGGELPKATQRDEPQVKPAPDKKQP